MSYGGLSDIALELIRKVAGDKEFKVGKREKAIGGSNLKDYLKELEAENLIERKGYGKFKVTEEGRKYEYQELRCEDCGSIFYSRIQAQNSGGMSCSHNSLSTNLGIFTE